MAETMSFEEKVKQWGANASQSISTTVENISTKVSGTAEAVAESFSKAFQDPQGLVTANTQSNQKPLTDTKSTMKDAYHSVVEPLFPIGRPCRFNNNIDSFQRFGNYLRTKMSVIDLVPVDYSFNFKRMLDLTKNQTSSDTAENAKNYMNMFQIKYEKMIQVYQRICKYHGLPNWHSGIRLYTTDDTTTNDTIEVVYKDSTFQGISDDTFSGVGQKFRDVASSFLGSDMYQFTADVESSLHEKIPKIVNKVSDRIPPEVAKLVGDLAVASTDIVMRGNKMTFPKIWQSSTYRGNLVLTIRLVSPYGHPKAIKEFILKPLSMLILLAAPQTINGVTYGGSIPVTIKAYGLNYTTLGAISSITFRRGGSDSSFSLYKQPLTLDLSIEFQTLFDAFAVFDPVVNDKLSYDKNIFQDKSLTDFNDLGRFSYNPNTIGQHLMTSLGTILTSLKPIGIMDTNVNPQVYGNFTPPQREDLPDTQPFVPITGNLGGAISGTVSGIGKLGQVITNAPKLIQQALSTAIYNAAKTTVGNISSATSNYINDVGGFATKVVNTVKGNFF